jgi:hypothetical protein
MMSKWQRWSPIHRLKQHITHNPTHARAHLQGHHAVGTIRVECVGEALPVPRTKACGGMEEKRKEDKRREGQNGDGGDEAFACKLHALNDRQMKTRKPIKPCRHCPQFPLRCFCSHGVLVCVLTKVSGGMITRICPIRNAKFIGKPRFVSTAS